MLTVYSIGDSVSQDSRGDAGKSWKEADLILSSILFRLHVSQAHLKPGQAQYKASSAVLLTGELDLGKMMALTKELISPFVLSRSQNWAN